MKAEVGTISVESSKDGGGFGWVKLPSREILERFWNGVLAMPQRMLFVARLDGELGPVKDALAARGATMEQQGAHVLLDLVQVSTSELARICADADVAIIELMPVSRPIQRAFL